MALKALIKSLEGVPSEQHNLYVKVGDDYVLDLDDRDYKIKLSEFRDNNVRLSEAQKTWGEKDKELENLRGAVEKFKDIDPEKARKAMEQMNAINEKQLMDAGKMDEVIEQRVNQRVANMKADYDGQVTALTIKVDELTSNSDNYKTRLSEVVIDNSLQTAISKVAAVKQGAMRDVISRGRESWRLDETGNPVPYSTNGAVVYGKDGKEPITMEEWAQGLVQEAGYLFEANKGGGAGGNMHSSGDGPRVLDAADQESINQNLEAIADGAITVRETG